jgi:putative intracellular protease/amidase
MRTKLTYNAILPARRITVLATPTAQALELAGPIEVFAMAERKLREAGRSRSPAYIIDIVSAVDDLTIHSSSGLSMLAHRPYSKVKEPVDTLLIAGGMDLWSAKPYPTLIAWLREQSKSVRRLASVCTGAFLLAEAGLLDGRRVTTHWYFCQQLQDQFPKLTVDPEPIFIRDGNISTSAGVTSGMDLALHRQSRPSNDRERYAFERRELVTKNLFSNLRRTGDHPTLSMLLELADVFSLTVEGAHRLFGYDLDAMREYDLRLNGGRTHIERPHERLRSGKVHRSLSVCNAHECERDK